MHSARDGSGEQTRDLLYVEDCTDFIVTTWRTIILRPRS